MTTRHSVGLRLIVACALALGMLTLPASSAFAAPSQATHAHGASAKGKGKKHKKKKKKSNAVIVKCASVTVTCKGTPGPQGPAGINGTNGANGPNGSAIVLRARGSGMAGAVKVPLGCTSFSCAEGGSVSVDPSTWTEAANEDDQMIGTLTLTLPGSKECGYEVSKKLEPAEVYVIVLVGSTVEGLVEAKGSTSPRTVTTSLFGNSFFKIELEEEELMGGETVGELGETGPGFFIGDGSSHTRTITVKAIDSCVSEHVAVNNVTIDVLASH